MSIRSESIVSDQYYHIYNRGNGKNIIFLDDEDYCRFLKILYVCNSNIKFNFRDSLLKRSMDAWEFDQEKTLVDVLAWVLMPNHFHIILTSPSPRQGLGLNNISVYMQKVSTAYAMYFNKKYKRTGSLFEGKFKSKAILEDNYFKYIFAYVHLNPIKLVQYDWKEKGIKNKDKARDFILNYKFSSFQDYVNNSRTFSKILNLEVLDGNFKNNHIRELFNWFKNFQP